jgi:hypothetical protein
MKIDAVTLAKCGQKKTLEKGEDLQGSNALSLMPRKAPLREEKREVTNHLLLR